MANAPTPKEKKSGNLQLMVQAESMIQVAIALPLGCVLGWLAGSWLDRHFHQGWIGVTGILLGAVGGFIQIYRTATRYLSPTNTAGDQPGQHEDSK